MATVKKENANYHYGITVGSKLDNNGELELQAWDNTGYSVTSGMHNVLFAIQLNAEDRKALIDALSAKF